MKKIKINLTIIIKHSFRIIKILSKGISNKITLLNSLKSS